MKQDESTQAPPRPYLQRSNERSLPRDYSGDILLWDIDKTYLDTRFSSWRGLLAIPFEFAIDKRTIPGAVPLLRALRRGPDAESNLVPLYFVSGSPQQLRRVVQRRMTLDGVDFDGITFKDQLGLLLSRRVGDLRSQIGYKLLALLLYWRELPPHARWLMFGDDVEADAEIFVLFGSVVSGLRGAALIRHLQQRGVSLPHLNAIVELCSQLPVAANPVERVFIHLERGQSFTAFSKQQVVASQSYIQTALVLCNMGKISPEAVATVARDLRLRGMPEAVLSNHLHDARDRLDVPNHLLALARPS